MNTLNASKTLTQSYAPLSIQNDTDGWSVTFRLQPIAEVVVSGAKPAYSDFALAAATACGGVGILTQVLYVAACVAFDTNR